ncbi:hypothetical protein [Cohnella sp. GbtcB17]|uniref:hypothetical protein n=1 Tax=Cohnella sp. GbtcB17 TaxID=2824762 RepID=UPI001C31153D|nr:hypothetical protein [Cohnella sp. GbtcB17]
MTSELRVDHCPGCGRIYQINLRQLCAACTAAEDALMNRMEKELRANRKLTTEELAERVEERPELIRSWIRRGKLKLYDYPNLTDACDLCEAPIRKGKLCQSCSMRIQSEVAHVYEQERLMQERKRRENIFLNKRK